MNPYIVVLKDENERPVYVYVDADTEEGARDEALRENPHLRFEAVHKADIYRYLSSKEAGEIWDRHPATIRDACAIGRLYPWECRKMPGGWNVSVAGMERLYGPRPQKAGEKQGGDD